jgi:hypothetical protein
MWRREHLSGGLNYKMYIYFKGMCIYNSEHILKLKINPSFCTNPDLDLDPDSDPSIIKEK